MKTSKIRRIVLITTASAAIVSVTTILTGSCKPVKDTRINSKTADAVDVRAARVRRGGVARKTWLTGEIVPDMAVKITPRIPGHLDALQRENGEAIEEGVMVEKGETIAILDHRGLEAGLESARASYRSALAARAVTQVLHADAEREMQRWTRLREQGVGTEQALDQARTAYERMKAELNAAEAGVETARAAVHQAEVSLNDAWIKAPFDGIVSRKYVDAGAYVAPGTPLLKLVNIDHVEVTGGLAGKYYSMVRPGITKATAMVDAYPDRSFTGLVARISPELERTTRTARVTVRLPNPDSLLKPGMYARLEITISMEPDALIVPDTAVRDTAGQPMVYVIENNIIRDRAVELGLREGHIYQVAGGLDENELVVTGGHLLLKPGMKVNPRVVE